jgi:hypothetical protein
MMKKIYILSLPGAEEKMIVAETEEEAFDRRAEVDPSYDYLPVQVKELEIEGHDIHVTAKKQEKPEVPEPVTPEIPVEKPPEKPKKPKQPKKASKK